MALTLRRVYCLISILFFVEAANGNTPLPGIITLKGGSRLVGFVSYRKIDVATRFEFYEIDSTESELDKSTKVIYGPNEVESFAYGSETWISISFSEKELGYQASYFLQQIDAAQGFALLGGMVTGEGCNCSGTKIDASYHWVLYNTSKKDRIILSDHRFSKIDKPEWVAAFFAKYNFDLDPSLFKWPKQVLKPLKP